MDEKSTIFEVIELKGSTTTLCYGDATKEKITKNPLTWKRAVVVSSASEQVGDICGKSNCCDDNRPWEIGNIYQRYLEQQFFCQYLCQYLPIYLCQYLPPTYPQQLPKLACTRWQHRAPERFTRTPVQKIVSNSLQEIILQSVNIMLSKTNALWWARNLGIGQEFLFK